MIKSVIWSPKERDTAIQMAQEGYTGSQIAQHLKRSRNSVIGFLHRSKIDLGKTNKAHRPRPVVSKPKPPPSKPKAVQTEIPIVSNEIPLMEARMFQCKFITKENINPFQIMCCGAETVYKSWCSKHFKIVFRPRDKK